jgi:hypothetical protein
VAQQRRRRATAVAEVESVQDAHAGEAETEHLLRIGLELLELDRHAGQRALSAGVVEVQEVVILDLAARNDRRRRVLHHEVHAHRRAQRHRLRYLDQDAAGGDIARHRVALAELVSRQNHGEHFLEAECRALVHPIPRQQHTEIIFGSQMKSNILHVGL